MAKTVTSTANPDNQALIDEVEKSAKSGASENPTPVMPGKPREVVDLGNGTTVEHF